eukprot:scaffold1634_cov118-Skeletonema_dohrnii-CCMP3373.AAC.22
MSARQSCIGYSPIKGRREQQLPRPLPYSKHNNLFVVRWRMKRNSRQNSPLTPHELLGEQ